MDIRKKQRAVVEALEEVKGRDIVVFNTERLPSMFERVIIASADSTRQVKALADRVSAKIKSLGAKVEGVEGDSSAEWVLVDLGEIVVHVMHHSVRAHYNLEELWGGKTVKIAPAGADETPVIKQAGAGPALIKQAGAKPAPRKLVAAKAPPAGKARAKPAGKAPIRAKPAKKPGAKRKPAKPRQPARKARA